MSMVALSLLLERMSSRDKDYRYMAASDLATELGKEGFTFESTAQEPRVADAIIKLLDDGSSDISSLALKCLGLLVARLGPPTVHTIVERLTPRALEEKPGPSPEDAALGLKTVINELPQDTDGELVNYLVPRLSQALSSKSAGARERAMDLMLDLLARFARCVHGPESLAKLLLDCLPQYRKKCTQCLALLAASMTPSQLDGLGSKLLDRNASIPNQWRLQALCGISKSTGWRFASHAQPTVELANQILAQTGDEGDEDLQEQCLQTLESVVSHCPSECKPVSQLILENALKYLRHDPNYQVEDDEDLMSEGEDAAAARPGSEAEEEEEDDDGLSEEEYSDDEDLSWKVRCAAAKLVKSIIEYRLIAPEELYERVGHLLVARFKEREPVVLGDIFEAFGVLLSVLKPAGPLLNPVCSDIPRMMRLLNQQMTVPGSKAAKIKVDVYNLLLQLISILPDETARQLPAIFGAIKSSLADTSSTVPTLKLAALQLLQRYLPYCASSGDTPASLAPVLRLVLQLTADRYYRVAAEALYVIEAAAPIPLLGAPDSLSLLFDAAAAVLARLARADQDQDVKEAAIAAAAALLACHGAELSSTAADSASIGALAQKFAAMPHAAKRAKLSDSPAGEWGSTNHVANELLGLLLQRLDSESTALAAIKGIERVATASPALLSGSVLEEQVVALTAQLRKANRALRAAALSALAALIERRGADVPAPTLADAIARAGEQITPAEVALSTTALRLSADALRAGARDMKLLSEAAAREMLPRALDLTAAPLLRPETCRALERFYAALADTGADAARFETLCDAISATGVRSEGTGLETAARCVAALSVGNQGRQNEVLEAQIQALQTATTQNNNGSAAKTTQVRFAFRVIGEVGLRGGLHAPRAEQVHSLIDAALHDEKLADVAAFALGGGTAGGAFSLVSLQNQIRSTADSPRLQYQYLRSLLVMLRACAASVAQLSSVDRQREILMLIVEASKRPGDECAGILAECLGTLCELPGLELSIGEVLGAHLRDPTLCTLALSAARHAATQLSTGAVLERDELLGRLETVLLDLLACVNDPDVTVCQNALAFLSAAAHGCPEAVRPHLASVLPVLLQQTVPRPDLVRVVNLGPFKHTIDEALGLRKAAFDALAVLLDGSAHWVDSRAVLEAVVSGLKDHYDIKVTCHSLLSRLASIEPDLVTSYLETLVEPLSATLTAKVKSDAVKQEIDRNDDLIRSCLRSVVALDSLAGARDVPAWATFMTNIVGSVALKAKYEAVKHDKV